MKDGVKLLFLLGVVQGLQAALGGEEAYKYVNPYILFWSKSILGPLANGMLLIKAYYMTPQASSPKPPP